jgi:2-polyprenyl-6-methoxyphenol hydroxylase-like FAD-dependent oxidoreductase
MNEEKPHPAAANAEVVVVGGGPAGMMLAAELALADVDVVVVERRETQDLESPRSRGLHARTIEVLDQRGIADRFLAEGTPMQVQAFAGIPLDISDFPTRHNYGLALVQSDVERIMAAWLAELEVPFIRGCEFTDFTSHDDHVEVTLAGGATMHAEYLVGCDGSRSLVRKKACIEFAGWDPSVCWITAEVEMREQPEFGMRGGGGIGPAEHGRVGVTLAEPDPDLRSHEPTLADLRAALLRVDGTDYVAHSPRYISRFTDMTRQAVTYRRGRVLIAGDAAHVHAPLGGQGLNLGVQDSVNLGWKLAQVVHGTSPNTLLDSYEAERHPVAAKVMQNTMAQRALSENDERTVALRDIVADLLTLDEARRSIAGMISGLDIRYHPDVDHHPMVGRRVPDVELETADGTTSVYEQIHDANALLIDLESRSDLDVSLWSARVKHIVGTSPGPWELPIVGTVQPPSALLVRPDGYVAWAGTGTSDGFHEALTTWFGAPTSP